jgi:hypothetical protein
MKGKLIALLVIAAIVGLAIIRPWQTPRYNSSPAGVEAKAIDKHVDAAKAWRPPNTWEAREFLTPTPDPKKSYDSMVGMSHAQALAMANAFYSAGATEVAYLNIKRGVRSGDNPEGFFVAVPDDPKKRKAIFSIAAAWPKPPKDVMQKYIYYGFGSWSPDDPEPGFLGD